MEIEAVILDRKPEVGDWVVIGREGSWSNGISFEVAKAERVTEKVVYAQAHHRTQHPIVSVLVTSDEATARGFVEKTKSAYAEAVRRERAAWDAYRQTIAKLSTPTPPAGGS